MKAPLNTTRFLVATLAAPVHALAHWVHVVAHLNLPPHVRRVLNFKAVRVALRFTVGTVVIIVGVLIARTSHHCEHWLLSACIDGFGYTLHAFGAAPFLAAISGE